MPKAYCNLAAIEKGLDPIGSAHPFTQLAIIEVPLPWKRNIYTEVGALPQEVMDLFALWMKRYREGQPYDRHILLVAPDEAYSRPGLRRVMFYRRPAPSMAEYTRVEYLVPEAEVGPLVWALHEAPEMLDRFAAFREPDAPIRDLLVCTHGTIDAACAKFGYPLYTHLRKNHGSELLRVWRVSHFGGHVFAPTLVDMPVGHYWAYVEEPQADAIAQRDGNPRDLYGHYRGWAGISGGFLQALERDLWMEHGFAWFSYQKEGRVIDIDPAAEPRWAEVELRYASPDGRVSGTVQARCEVTARVPVIHSSASDKEQAYPQYAVTAIRVPAGV